MVTTLISGLPGKMATEIVKEIEKHDDINILPCGFSSERNAGNVYQTPNGNVISLLGPSEREKILKLPEVQPLDAGYRPVIAVDASTPSAGTENALWFAKNYIPFVLLTTGVDYDKIEEKVEDSNICAVISPNMSPEITVINAMLEYAAKQFPKAWEGMEGIIKESHQQGKKDTSGTAKKNKANLEKLGVGVKDIIPIRDPSHQKLLLKVPEEHLGGHGWHTYAMQTPGGDVYIEIRHNVNGRETYARGTILAIYYLDHKMMEGERGKVYSMEDVLRGI